MVTYLYELTLSILIERVGLSWIDNGEFESEY